MNLPYIIVNRMQNREICSEGITTFLNPHTYVVHRDNPELLSRFDHICFDGIMMVKALRMAGVKDAERISFDMTSLAPEVFHTASEKGLSVYFVGAKPGVIEKGVEKISASYPELRIAGYRNGYFKDNEREESFERIKDSGADIVVCGMGAPLQEEYLADLKDSGWTGCGYTCGGFLHQTAEGIKYYPDWADRYNLRWAYRIYDEPYLFKRYLTNYSRFALHFLRDMKEFRRLCR
ncbi:WecB/TagA/CpsF family glycosyltransferase [Limisalsivibrio acetivorans]|uniref:WecB/TagA/CpsF family glycosyltransferase n=1 Tax=Limisalsivibrio acetivorans TaxID=1304888 RepID=UPI00041FADB0|nr:WecB/TagA/CpsF family glycosyltransferase [Limisalsivibrio acetivorans]